MAVADSLLSLKVRDKACNTQHKKAGARLAARNGGESKPGTLPFNSISLQ